MRRIEPFLAAGAVCLSLMSTGCKPDEAGAGQTQTQTQPTGPDTITLNASTVFQTIHAWEHPLVSTVVFYAPVVPFIGPITDQAVNELGLTRISINIFPGIENTSDTCQVQYITRVTNEAQFRQCLYSAVNDNADPNVVNPNGFQWTVVDWQIEKILLPMKQRVEARGEQLYTALRYVDFLPSTFEHNQNPDEYAELIQATFDHMRDKYGFVPDGLDVMNEPDNVTGYDPTTLGRLTARTGARLAARGYPTEFIGPSTTDKGSAVKYFDGMWAVAGASQYLKELSWHCYFNTDPNSSTAMASRATQYGVRTSLTECWNESNTYTLLHQELKASRNSSWQLALLHGNNGYFEFNASTGQATLRPKAQYIRQYFKHVRPGARRIEAVSSDSRFDPVAFVNKNGSYVVVVKATGGGDFSIGNLPAGNYGVFYTTGPNGLTVTNYDVNAGDRTVTAGRSLSTSIPSAGVITIYAKNAAPTGAGRLTPSAASVASTGAVQGSAPREASAAWPTRQQIATQDGVHFRLERIAGAISDPVDIAFAGTQLAFVAERDRILVLRGNQISPSPAVVAGHDDTGDERFVALAADPDFDRTRYVYVISTVSALDGRSFTLARYREVAGTLAERVVLLDGVPSAEPAAAASLRFGPDGKLFAAFDDAGDERLGDDLASNNGKVLRLNSDGSTPRDQPNGNPLFAYRYRSPRGLGWHPTSHALWIADASASRAGSLDVVETDPRSLRAFRRAAFALPPGIEPSAVAFYGTAGNAHLRDNLLVASDEGRQIIRMRLDTAQPPRVIAAESLLADTIGGIHALAVAPDGAIYFATSDALGRLVPEK